MPIFLSGPLADAALLAQVFGQDMPAPRPARLAGHALMADGAEVWPAPAKGAAIDGLLLDPQGQAAARLAFLLAGLGAAPESVRVTEGGQAVPATLWRAALPDGAVSWDRAAWAPVWQGALGELVADILALLGQAQATALAARRGPALVHAASRARARKEEAASPPPATRRDASAGDVTIHRHRRPYAAFFAVDEYDLSFRRFDGTDSPTVTRAVFLSGDAVVVLPYDPVRDRVLLIEQFRAAPMARGQSRCWSLEAVAGRIDPGETPEQAARREAAEEAGLTLGAMLPVAAAYPSPGAVAEYLYNFVALCDLPDGCQGVFGVEGEAEDIRGHLLPFSTMMDLVRSGEIDNGPLLLIALWLDRERPRLRAGQV